MTQRERAAGENVERHPRLAPLQGAGDDQQDRCSQRTREKREKVLETVLDKISLILKQEPFDLSSLNVWFIKTFLIKRKLKKLLGLKGEPPEETPLDIA